MRPPSPRHPAPIPCCCTRKTSLLRWDERRASGELCAQLPLCDPLGRAGPNRSASGSCKTRFFPYLFGFWSPSNTSRYNYQLTELPGALSVFSQVRLPPLCHQPRRAPRETPPTAAPAALIAQRSTKRRNSASALRPQTFRAGNGSPLLPVTLQPSGSADRRQSGAARPAFLHGFPLCRGDAAHPLLFPFRRSRRGFPTQKPSGGERFRFHLSATGPAQPRSSASARPGAFGSGGGGGALLPLSSRRPAGTSAPLPPQGGLAPFPRAGGIPAPRVPSVPHAPDPSTPRPLPAPHSLLVELLQAEVQALALHLLLRDVLRQRPGQRGQRRGGRRRGGRPRVRAVSFLRLGGRRLSLSRGVLLGGGGVDGVGGGRGGSRRRLCPERPAELSQEQLEEAAVVLLLRAASSTATARAARGHRFAFPSRPPADQHCARRELPARRRRLPPPARPPARALPSRTCGGAHAAGGGEARAPQRRERGRALRGPRWRREGRGGPGASRRSAAAPM